MPSRQTSATAVEPRPLTRERAEQLGEVRWPIFCDCGQGDPAEHIICSNCGDDWDYCECGTPDSEDVPWMLAEMGGLR